MYVHPELTEILEALPARPESVYDDIAGERDRFRAFMSPLMADDPRVVSTTATFPAADGTPLHAHVIRPRAGAPAGVPLPAVLYLHGGGFAYGELDGPGPMARELSAEAGVVVVDASYRLAPEHRFPAGVEDCYAALRWMATNADRLGIDPARIGVAGASAGGNLSAAVALMARDRGGPAIAHQCLLIPLLDDRETASRSVVVDRRVVDGPGIRNTWTNYLGERRDPATTSPYAAPARAADLSGLPPAYVLTCGLDPLRDEGLDYARRLAAADVPVDVRDVPGAWHFFEAYAPQSALARRTTAHWIAAIREALSVSLLAAA